MKKILVRAFVLVAIVAMFSLPMTANAQEQNDKPQPRTVTAQQNTQEEKLFIGLIKGYKDGIVEVGKLFDLENDFNETDTIYIDVTKAEFPNGEVKEYPNGYLITINYNDIVKEDNGYKIIATKINAVEEDKVVSICDEDTATDEVKEQIQVEENTTEVKCVEVEPSFWDKIVAFFKNLFS